MQRGRLGSLPQPLVTRDRCRMHFMHMVTFQSRQRVFIALYLPNRTPEAGTMAPDYQRATPRAVQAHRVLGTMPATNVRAIFLEQNDEWAGQRAHRSTLETIVPLGNDAPSASQRWPANTARSKTTISMPRRQLHRADEHDRRGDSIGAVWTDEPGQ
jgi:hypothetical protein